MRQEARAAEEGDGHSFCCSNKPKMLSWQRGGLAKLNSNQASTGFGLSSAVYKYLSLIFQAVGRSGTPS